MYFRMFERLDIRVSDSAISCRHVMMIIINSTRSATFWRSDVRGYPSHDQNERFGATAASNYRYQNAAHAQSNQHSAPDAAQFEPFHHNSDISRATAEVFCAPI
jgi:hypothetical protein